MLDSANDGYRQCRNCRTMIEMKTKRHECNPCRYERAKRNRKCDCGGPISMRSTTCAKCFHHRPAPLELLEHQRGWIAGLCEGEGTFTFRENRPIIRLQMTDEDTIRRLSSWTGIGNIGRHLPRNIKHKTSWHWSVCTKDHWEWLVTQISPLLGERRRAAISTGWLISGRSFTSLPKVRALEPKETLPWVAGLLEGEGTIYISPRKDVSVEMTSTDRDILERMLAITGMGRIYDRPIRDPRWRPTSTWRITRISDVKTLLPTIRPFLMDRRGKAADHAMSILAGRTGRK
ncbi:LAGLIDADG family homing endonuclease [Actinoplanes regularis]|uniref:LAGLIDADG family homing endonuclease n=1 Tax=Actinoplanes regularis TaxID=52697 RepID=UPI002553E1DD|nr:LAGLIDADG family homing endonuclease [Actinoplanes regularis]